MTGVSSKLSRFLKIRSGWLAAAAVLWAGLAAPHAQGMSFAGFDAYVRKSMDTFEVPGAAIAIVEDDRVVFLRTYGLRDIASHKPVDEHTMFAIASCTKSFTAASLAMLVDEGKLDWDYHGHVIDEHGGNIDGQSAEVAMMPDLHVGFVLLSNMDSSSMRTALMYRIFDAYLGRPQKDWSAQIHKDTSQFFAQMEAGKKKRDAERVRDTSPALPLADYVGTFHNDFFGDLHITLESGKLVLRFGTPILESALEHWQYDTFQAHWDDPLVREGKLNFVLNAQGKANELRFDLTEGARYPFERVVVPRPAE